MIIDLNKKDRFYLSEDFKENLRGQETKFGFGILGAVVYARTYSRLMDDGRQELWPDTVIRVVEGLITIRKWHYLRNHLKWDNVFWNHKAEEIAQAIFDIKLLGSGRGLWAMGSETVYKIGSAALNNCGSVDVKILSEDAAWTMDFLMLGVGTGHNTTTFENPQYFIPEEGKNEVVYKIPDSREGWVESLRRLIASYETQGSPRITFDYSKIRKAGEPIRGFGGTASGPDPLIKLHERVRGYLDNYALGKTSGVRMVVDTMNAIGACVVAGNVRRSAEISLGNATDEEFINLKNYELNPERSEIGWMSNNSIIIKELDDLKALPNIAERVRNNGEPGLINLLNIQKYGRYGEKSEDKATSTNPCAEIPLESYELCNLAEVFPTRCVDENGEFSKEEFERVLSLAALYTSTVSLLPTHDPKTNAVVARNRRTGVSLSGIADWMADHAATNVITWLDDGYRVVREENNRLNQEAGVPPAVRVTTVKPSGTVSLLAGVSSGMHLPPFSRYVRRVRVGENTPIVPLLIEAGIPYEQDVYSDNTLVFEFPVDQGKVKGQKDVSVWAKAQTVVMLQRWWADNMVSNTLTFDPVREGDQIEDLLTFTVPNIKSISLLPLLDEGSVYEQSPIEQITLEEVNRRKKEIGEIDWSKFGGSDGSDSKFCANDVCEI